MSGKAALLYVDGGDRNKVAKVCVSFILNRINQSMFFAAASFVRGCVAVVADKFGKNKNTIENVSGFL